ncbi:MAG: PAS domain S-box protein [Oscillatoriales cyanobacterium C42_A2020_001]|nr:PAS domain S-box protein [Leptolyngbyaceae cyanobacterium C42_A2020_001]
MNNISSLNRRVKSASERLSELYRVADASPSPDPELLPTALKELGIVSEALQIAIQELTRQNDQLVVLQNELKEEQQRYQDLFEHMPDGCVLTDSHGVVKQANCAMTSLINTQAQFLVGKSLSSLIVPEDASLFQTKLSQITQSRSHLSDRIEFSVRLYRRPTNVFIATLAVNVVRKQGDGCLLQWVVRDITERKRAEAALDNPEYDPSFDRPLYHFNKGETIPFEPHSVWLVVDGVVKLTTMSERGEEVIMGLVGNSMVFGATLTALQTYQAIALSNVKLALIPISEIAQSPQLAQALLSSLKQRLQQTESLLAIYGQIRVEERLNSFLNLLKQVIGQPVEQGVRLRARLTHQDFANACCTTRVTVTRLLGKLQEQGKIFQDAHNHLILRDCAL